MTATPLRLSSLPALAGRVSVPTYDRDGLSAGIVHFGVGNFHRAHQGIYLNELFNKGLDHDWAIVGAGVRPSDAMMRDALQKQDWLSTIVERDAHTEQGIVTGVMIDYVEPGATNALLEKLADPDIRIVSMTITEGGYYLDASTGQFDPTHSDIVADRNNPSAPKTVFGLIVEGLRQRRAAGIAPFTVMSCDNIPSNGHVTADAVIGLARLSNPELADWIAANVAFPNSMVDRITPATGEAERALVANEYGIADNWPTTCETFRQWVVEDNFPMGRPRLEDVGVTFVKDVEPFELMKLRILNGGHAAIAYPAGLMDIDSVEEAMANPLIAAWLEKLERDEIIPAVPPVPGVDLSGYYETVAERFANPNVGDTIRRLCLDGSNRQPKFVLPTVIDRLKAGQQVTGLALASALWCRYCAGTTDSGAEIAPNDPDWDNLQSRARDAKADPMAFLGMQAIFGGLANDAAYVQSFSNALATIWSIGTQKTLERYLAGEL